MASDGVPVTAAVQATHVAPVAKIAPAAKVAQASNPAQAAKVAKANQPRAAATNQSIGGTTLPSNGVHAAPSAAPAASTTPAKTTEDLQAITTQLNKHLQESGRPTQFRLDSSTGRTMIQEVNPDTGEVVGEILASEFRGLAQGLTQESGISGLLLNTRA